MQSSVFYKLDPFGNLAGYDEICGMLLTNRARLLLVMPDGSLQYVFEQVTMDPLKIETEIEIIATEGDMQVRLQDCLGKVLTTHFLTYSSQTVAVD